MKSSTKADWIVVFSAVVFPERGAANDPSRRSNRLETCPVNKRSQRGEGRKRGSLVISFSSCLDLNLRKSSRRNAFVVLFSRPLSRPFITLTASFLSLSLSLSLSLRSLTRLSSPVRAIAISQGNNRPTLTGEWIEFTAGKRSLTSGLN